MVYSVATPPAPRWAVIDLVGAGRLFSIAATGVALGRDERASRIGVNLMRQMASYVRKTERWLVDIL